MSDPVRRGTHFLDLALDVRYNLFLVRRLTVFRLQELIKDTRT
jgi:hypothetical protein